MNLDLSNNTFLISALKNGEAVAYTFLLKKYHNKLCIYAYTLTNDYDLSEDIVQNVFMGIWNTRHKLKDDFTVKSYLYKSVYNEFLTQYRKQKSVSNLEKKYIDALSTIVEEEDDKSLDKLINIVKREIDNLPPKCKEVFLLSKQEGLANIEIAEFLNISIKTVEAQVTKAFKLLRKKLGPSYNSILFLTFRVNPQSII